MELLELLSEILLHNGRRVAGVVCIIFGIIFIILGSTDQDNQIYLYGASSIILGLCLIVCKLKSSK